MTSVKVHVYDLSQGLAKALSSQILGQHVDGIWHTGIVVYGKEHFFGSGGIETCPPGGTVLGNPQEVVDLGLTEIPEELFISYLAELAESTFRPESYHLFDHNCNTFSDEIAFFLTNKRVPSHITDLPRSIATTPIGQMVRSLVDRMSAPGPSSNAFCVPEVKTPTSTKVQTPTSSSPNSASPKPGQQSPSPEPSSLGEPVLIKVDITEEESNLFSNNANSSSSFRGLHEFATATEEPKWGLGPKHFSLLGKELQEMEEEEQHLVLALFRVSLCRSVDVAMGLLHDRNRHFLSLLEDEGERSPNFKSTLLQMACNCVGKLGIEKESVPEPCRMPLVQFSVQSLDEGSEKLLASQLAFNLTVVQAVQDDAAILSLGSILIHVLCNADASSTCDANRYAVKALLNICRLNDDIRQLALVQGLDASTVAGADGERLHAILHGHL